MQLKDIVPWGRSFDEYRDMFLLTGADLQKTILGCGDGPASFNAELTKAGGNVVLVDPVYRFTVEPIRSRVREVYPEIMSEVAKNPDDYVWESIRDIGHLGKVRMKVMERSHYLFFYSDHLSLEQHILSVKELCRVANEVRVYPLVTLERKRSPHLDAVVRELKNGGLDVSFHKVRYRFQKGAEEMLVAK